MEMPKARYSHAKGLSSLIVELDPDQTNEIGIAQQLAFRACNDRFPIGAENLRKAHRFVALYREELAWLGDPRRGSTGGLTAPSGGWPEWKPPGMPPQPGPVGSPLAADTLFQRLAPSVLVVETRNERGTAQGSGVAVGSAEVLTNCHVLAGAQKIQLKQKESTWGAALDRADPKGDRCVLRVSGPPLVPVPGVRSYGDLKVGEPLFALGSPRGLELTLSEGILSGLREEEGLKFVQTTAPISPGSSGGGLFDARGNLVGITTLVLAGKERLNQALNFALPADSFFLP
jgi:S1-C subfamily serine protease